MAANFNSDGFDLDALPDAGGGDGSADVIYEVGGRAVVVEEPKPPEDPKPNEDNTEKETSPVARSEELKSQGNEEFQNQNYLEAHDMYSAAIEACPGMTGKEILALRDEFDDKERARVHELHRLDAQEKARKKKTAQDEGKKEPAAEEEPQPEEKLKPRQFEAPSHPHGKELGIYHCNRAACSLHLKNYESAIADSDIAILLRPDWAKAYVRRSTAYEHLEEQTDKALVDAKKALELDPKNTTIRKNVQRLQKLEDERLEKLKEETLGKLKDLGNSILGNFGLSLDNFQTKQDPNTGSYSIAFNQDAQK